MLDATTAAEGSGDGRRATPVASGYPGVVRGLVLGRYVVLGPRGTGAMGVVYDAYDPELDRKVALKLLRSHDGASTSRMIREARALAKLSHANVVTVHDVGWVPTAETSDEFLFIAMELVDGVDLGRWLAARRRSWPEIRRAFVAAGRGLVAAHEAGLVHRDFKPANVLVGNDGGVKVADFGLAAPTGSVATTSLDDDESPREVVGTPRYMAPEVHAGRAADARADLYAFCIALFEALHGAPPFVGADEAELIAAKRRSLPRPPSGGIGPPHLHRLFARGLAVDPADRHPSMAALLEELESEPSWRRHRGALSLTAAGLIAVSAAAFWPAAPSPEVLARRQIDEVWSPAAKQQLRQATTKSERSFAEASAATVERTIDAYADAWISGYVDAHRASARGEHSTALLDLRLSCLRQRLAALQAQIQVLASADDEVALRAVDSVARLPAVDRCADLEALRSRVAVPDSPVVMAAVAELRRRLVEVDALERAGAYQEGLRQATLARADAQAIASDHPPVLAEALLRHGLLAERTGDFATAEAELVTAAELAESVGDDETATVAAAEVLFVVGHRRQRHAEALLWAHHVRALTRRAGADPEHRALLLDHLGNVHETAGHHDEAEAAYRESIAIYEAERGEDHPLTALVRSNLANLHSRGGKHADAIAGHRRALADLERWLGPEHPELTHPLLGLGADLLKIGQPDEARAVFERVLTIREQALGADHPDVAIVHNNLGSIDLRRQAWPEALAHFERALAIWQRGFGASHPNVALALGNIAILHFKQGRYREAAARFEELLARIEGSVDATHPQRVTARLNLGGVLRKLGRCDEAARILAETRALAEASGDEGSPTDTATVVILAAAERCRGRLDEALQAGALALDHLAAAEPSTLRSTSIATVRITLAEVELERGEPRAADEHLARAAEAGPDVRLQPLLDLARAKLLWRTGQRPEARALALAARAGLARVEPEGSMDLDGADRWLAEHPG
ncbi:serine/threonine-protein kinase [Nannocystis radixulma]|uniref:Serine/threonine-protein kinase n=1 Tax=Nannocystis radixulma TaxID=2995305 RepID=A0ABT5AZ37_9BACT|nr:serine/threonine-protein kinase [Nannocystis radixulma]MDC0667100.1 serine/threonine-protein kinase [Nannocystis radixulma]